MLLEFPFITALLLVMVVLAWEAIKAAYAAYKERNSVWISFEDRYQAAAAIDRVREYFTDTSKTWQARVVLNSAGIPRFDVLVPKSMLNSRSFEDSMGDFTREIAEAAPDYGGGYARD